MTDRHEHLPGTAGTSHIDIVKRLYAAFARRDMAAILGMLSPDVVWAEPDNPHNPAAGTRHGHAGFLEWARIGNDAEDILTLEPTRFLTDEGAVAVVGHMRCRARATGKTYSSEFVHLIGFENDKVVLFREFFDTYAAAEAFRPTPD